jgi:hypothetical protein
VKDPEFIYSLYVQANPVPDPDLVPLTRDEARLPLFERSQDMINEEQTYKKPALSPWRRRTAVALGAAAVLVVAVGAAAIVLNRDSGPVAAGDANPVVVFDGTTCSYEGPTSIEEGLVDFSLTNSASEVFNFATFRMLESALAQELQEHPVGTDWAEPPDSPVPLGVMSFAGVYPGEPYRSDWLLDSGTYLFECTTGVQSGGIPEHVWRIAQVEVVASG